METLPGYQQVSQFFMLGSEVPKKEDMVELLNIENFLSGEKLLKVCQLVTRSQWSVENL